MNILLMVNASPWADSRAAVALRFARAACEAGMSISAVYFRGDGVYHALPGRQRDEGADDLFIAWSDLAQDQNAELLLCSAAAARRFPEFVISELARPWREAGLGEFMGWMERSDRVVSF